MSSEEKKQEPTAVEETEEKNSQVEEPEKSTEETKTDPVADLTEQLSEMEDKFLRAQAEIVNMRNRFQKEREGLVRYNGQELAKALIPSLDNLERALEIHVTDEQGINLKKGIEMVLESLLQGLKENGIEEIETEGKIFDPNLHQAVQTVPLEEGQKPDQIVQVLQKGYQLRDRILRPSMVIVAQ